MSKTVSIAMATYNGARYIAEQLDSLACQTLLPNELVVTDDCSTDNTLEIVAAFAAKAPFPVRAERNSERLGYRANFMKAAGLCASEYISFCDQDDVWLPKKLEICMAAFDLDDVLLTYHNAMVVNDVLQPISHMDFSAAPQALNPPLSLEPWKSAGWGFTVIISRFLLQFNDLWPRSVDVHKIGEIEKHDQWFFFLASSLGTIAYEKECLALYRQHGKNAVGWRGGGLDLKTKIMFLIQNDLTSMKSQQISAASRASLLQAARSRLDEKYRARAAAAIACYRKTEEHYRSRVELYESSNFIARFKKLTTLYASGGYVPKNQWGTGKQAFVRDIIRGVVFPARV